MAGNEKAPDDRHNRKGAQNTTIDGVKRSTADAARKPGGRDHAESLTGGTR